MDFFEQIGEKIMATGNELSQKAKEMSSVASLKNQIRDEENKIAKIYQAIGQKYYEAHKDDESDAFAEDFASIVAAQEGIKTLNEQINEIKGIVKCAECGADVDAEAAFCSKCGAKRL